MTLMSIHVQFEGAQSHCTQPEKIDQLPKNETNHFDAGLGPQLCCDDDGDDGGGEDSCHGGRDLGPSRTPEAHAAARQRRRRQGGALA